MKDFARAAKLGGYDPETRAVTMTWTTGATVRRWGYDPDTKRFGEFDEELVVSADSINMERINSGNAPLLNSHRSYSTTDVVGRIEAGSVELDGNNATARAIITDAADAAPTRERLQDGTLRNVSVGYSIDAFERIVDKERAVPLIRVTRWTPAEVSLVPVGADPGAGVRDNDSAIQVRGLFPAEAQEQNVGNTATQPPAPAVDSAALKREGIELSRRAESLGNLLGLDATTVRAAVDANESEVDVFKALHAAAEKRQKPAPVAHSPSVEASGTTDAQKRSLLLERRVSAKLRQFGMKLDDSAVADQAEFGNVRMVRLASDFLSDMGETVPRSASDYDIMKRALAFRSGQGMQHTTSDFASVLQNAMHNSLRAESALRQSTYRLWCTPFTFSDFRAHPITHMAADAGIEEVGENEEFTFGSVSDEHESVTALSYGRLYGLSLQALVNDYLNAFASLPSQFVARVERKKNALAYAKLTGNANMGDGNAIFSAAHGNIVSSSPSPGVPARAQLTAMRKLMAAQTDVAGNSLDLRIRLWLCAEDLLEDMQVLLGQTIQAVHPTDPGASGTAIPSSLNHPIASDFAIDSSTNGTTKYYGFADLSERAFIAGGVAGQSLTVETKDGWEISGIQFKLSDTFGVGPVNYRAMVYNPGQ